MKAIINGTRYDTEKAELIGETDNLGHGADSTRDFQYWSAGLYTTPRSGRYFLAGEGGARSMWARSAGQRSWTGGEGIKPLTEAAAFEWAQQELSTEVVEQHFSHLIVEA